MPLCHPKTSLMIQVEGPSLLRLVPRSSTEHSSSSGQQPGSGSRVGGAPSEPEGEDLMAAGAFWSMSPPPNWAAWKAASSAAAIAVADCTFTGSPASAARPEDRGDGAAGCGLIPRPGVPGEELRNRAAESGARPFGDATAESAARCRLPPLVGTAAVRRSACVRRSLSCWDSAAVALRGSLGAPWRTGPGWRSCAAGAAAVGGGAARHTMGWWRWRLLGAEAGSSPSSSSDSPPPPSPLPHRPFRFASPPATTGAIYIWKGDEQGCCRPRGEMVQLLHGNWLRDIQTQQRVGCAGHAVCHHLRFRPPAVQR